MPKVGDTVTVYNIDESGLSYRGTIVRLNNTSRSPTVDIVYTVPVGEYVQSIPIGKRESGGYAIMDS